MTEIHNMVEEFHHIRGSAKQFITKEEFFMHYPDILKKVTTNNRQSVTRGIDIAFSDLSLKVMHKTILDNLSGRIEENKMTAIIAEVGVEKLLS